MALLIYPDEKTFDMLPENGLTFSIYEISHLLNGVIEVAFVGNNWIFSNKVGNQLGLSYNKKCSEIFNYPIYGICMLVPMEELPAQFFIPKEPPPYMDKLIKLINEENDYEENDYDKKSEISEDVLIEYWNIAYETLFNKNKTFDDIEKDFIVYEKGKEIVKIPNENTKRIDFLNSMISFFQEYEEYEKCSQIIKLKNFLENK